MSDAGLIDLDDYQAIDRDWLLGAPDEFDNGQELANAAAIALGTDRLARADDALPNPDSSDRRGWWADLEADVIWNAGPIGCRLWLLDRDTITGFEARKGSTVAKVEGYIREAVQPYKEQRICSAITILAERDGVERIGAALTLHRGPLSAVQLRFAGLWTGIRN